MTTINSEALYDKYMNRFDFTSLANPKVYLDWTHVYTISIVGLREKFARLAEILLSEGKKDKAIKVLDKITTMLPHERVPYNYEILEIINAYFLAGQKSKGEDLLRKLENISKENLQYFRVLKTEELGGVGYETKVNLIVMRELAGIAERNHLGNISKEIIDYLNNMDPRLLQYLQQQQ
jgi:tetratricopeptide (TPR) repeat protein